MSDVVASLRGAKLNDSAVDDLDQVLEEGALEIERLRAALKPFADAAKCAEDDEADNYGLDCSSARHELTIGDLLRAKSALAPPSPSTPGRER